MGCDIHMMVEVKRSINGEEKWVNYDHFRKNPWYGNDDGEREFERIDLESSRNYAAFSQLCGVRHTLTKRLRYPNHAVYLTMLVITPSRYQKNGGVMDILTVTSVLPKFGSSEPTLLQCHSKE